MFTDLWPSFLRQRTAFLGLLLVFLGLSLPPLILVYFLREWFGISYSHLTRDLATVADLPPYTGFLSNLGLWVWSSAAAICLFEGVRRPGPWRWTSLKAFLVYVGLFTLLLTFDDWFLLHEEIFPKLHIPERAMYVFYALAAPLFMLACWRVVLRSDYWLLGAALGLLALSIVIDQVPLELPIRPTLLEDIFKFMGICAWTVYFVWLALRGQEAGGGD